MMTHPPQQRGNASEPALERLGNDTDVAFIFNPTLTGEELLRAISVELGLLTTGLTRAQLSDQLNEGLAGFTFNLSFDGGDLAQANTPTTSPLDNFAPPLGLSNPAGFGGTIVGGDGAPTKRWLLAHEAHDDLFAAIRNNTR